MEDFIYPVPSDKEPCLANGLRVKNLRVLKVGKRELLMGDVHDSVHLWSPFGDPRGIIADTGSLDSTLHAEEHRLKLKPLVIEKFVLLTYPGLTDYGPYDSMEEAENSAKNKVSRRGKYWILPLIADTSQLKTIPHQVLDEDEDDEDDDDEEFKKPIPKRKP